MRQVTDQQSQLMLGAVAGPGADDVQHPNGHFRLPFRRIVGKVIARSAEWTFAEVRA
ncbi:hypothetical protein Abr02nite_20190 [Paractinoplanes brasiliensis]|nr:hypothetical protein Abr02nite_20190 [Actinoplanes brasiliensis]